MRFPLLPALAVLIAGCHAAPPAPISAPEAGGSRHLFVWAADADNRESDFLAVVDVDPRSPTYAEVIATVPVGAAATMAHHTEYEMPVDGELWANGFAAGRTFRFDLRDPARPRLAGSFAEQEGFSHPHSFARLPNGHVLGAFQHRAGDRDATGGLVELDAQGRLVRVADAAVPQTDSAVRPYSLVVVPALDRVVSTATDMNGRVNSRAIQVWRLSDLTLLHTLLLPPGPRGDENWMTAEPRVLADGRTVLVNTFRCGLYRLVGLESDAPRAEWVYSSPWAPKQGYCAVPVVAGRFWIQPSGPEHSVVTLDLSDPAKPREIARLTLPPDQVPHWLGLEPSGTRVVITGYRALAPWVLLATLDGTSGRLAIDTTFRARGADRPGVFLGRDQWPHGTTGPAMPHGAVFARP